MTHIGSLINCIKSTKCFLFQQVDRKSLVYHMDAGAHEDADQDLPDEFFEVTVDDIRKRFAQLKSQRQVMSACLTEMRWRGHCWLVQIFTHTFALSTFASL